MTGWKRGTAEYNRKKRIALHAQQGGVCFYCRRDIGIHVGEKRSPVLDHHKPESLGGGRRHLVLACASCDRHKGMLDGHAFKAIIAQFATDLPPTERQLQLIYGRAKGRNIQLQKAHALANPGRSLGLTGPASGAISEPCLSHAEITLAVANDSGNAGAANTRLGVVAEDTIPPSSNRQDTGL